MIRSAARTAALVGIVAGLAALIACGRAHSNDYETGDGIPAVPSNAVALNNVAGP